MSSLSTYVEKYHGHEYEIHFANYENGINFSIKAGPLPWRPYRDVTYATYNEAFSAGVAEAQRLIDNLPAQ